jgi:hypothetical protein
MKQTLDVPHILCPSADAHDLAVSSTFFRKLVHKKLIKLTKVFPVAFSSVFITFKQDNACHILLLHVAVASTGLIHQSQLTSALIYEIKTISIFAGHCP